MAAHPLCEKEDVVCLPSFPSQVGYSVYSDTAGGPIAEVLPPVLEVRTGNRSIGPNTSVGLLMQLAACAVARLPTLQIV